MPYADAAFYTGTYKGTVIPTDLITKFLEMASDSIDTATFMRIPNMTLSTKQMDRVKLATCYQADHLYSYGDAITANLQSYSVGDVSMNLGQKDLRYSRQMLEYLMPTGLLNRLI